MMDQQQTKSIDRLNQISKCIDYYITQSPRTYERIILYYMYFKGKHNEHLAKALYTILGFPPYLHIGKLRRLNLITTRKEGRYTLMKLTDYGIHFIEQVILSELKLGEVI